ncbi:MAG: mgtE-like transporter [Acidimicrobiaceae bacterium]|jgi:mgtE-like transporter
MRRLRFSLLARLRALLGSDASGVRQTLVAQSFNSSTSFVAGAFLGAITETLAKYPGLLVLVPAAIGLRGNIFGTFGNRISTSIHAGTFRLSARRDTVLGQNILASMVLTVGASLLLALAAKGAAVALGIQHSIPTFDLTTISIVGGVLGSIVVLGLTLGVTAGAVRYGWDLDNVSAPLVGVLGDVLTLPALYLATFLIGISVLTPTLNTVLVVIAVIVLIVGWRSQLAELRRIVRESLPILVVAGCVSAGAGLALEKSFAVFDKFPALLVLEPAHLSSGGALGGVLAGRLATKMFLGTSTPSATPDREARRDIALLFLLAVPIYLFNGVGAQLVALGLGYDTPGWGQMIGVSLVAGMGGLILVAAVAYYTTVAAVRTGLDPDNYGIPVTSSFVDLVGAMTLIITISAFYIS